METGGSPEEKKHTGQDFEKRDKRQSKFQAIPEINRMDWIFLHVDSLRRSRKPNGRASKAIRSAALALAAGIHRLSP